MTNKITADMLEALDFDDINEVVNLAKPILERKRVEAEERLHKILNEAVEALGYKSAAEFIAVKPKKSKGVSNLPPKFVGPNGETWNGKGKPPVWMKALIEAGRAKEEFISEDWQKAKAA